MPCPQCIKKCITRSSADVYIGIVAWRYGYVPPRRKRSVTHLEYLEAKRRGLPCFLFLADPASEHNKELFPISLRDANNAPQLAAFRAELQRAHVVDYFTTPDDLAKKVATALHGYLLRQQDPDQGALAAAEARYRQQVVAAYRTLRISGFEQSDLFLDAVPLEQVFVRLNLTVEQTRRVLGGQEAQGRSKERVVMVQEPITLAQALKKPLLLVGEPGAGKSTLLRWLAVTFAQGTQRDPERIGPEAPDRLPVLIELGNLPGEYLQGDGGQMPNWQDLIHTLLTKQQRFAGMPPSLLQQALAEGRCLLLFDGLDEIANRQARARIARSLSELPRLWPSASIIIGSRPAGLSESEGVLRPTFQRCEIQRFTPEDLQRFFRFWYALDRTLAPEQQEQAATVLFTRLQATSRTLALATTPLLATILLLLWRNEGTLPERRTDLYERCCRVLVQAWERDHDVSEQGLLARLDWEQHLQVLTPIAYAIHRQEGRTRLSRQELLPLLEQALQTTKLCPDPLAAAQEARQFLEVLGLRSGLLQSLGDEQYGFPHLTFQEYMAARSIADQADPTSSIDLVLEHLHEAWWQEVHLLTIGYLGSDSASAPKAGAVLLAILRRYRPPSRFLRSSRHRWLRRMGPGQWLPRAQLVRRLAWMLKREERLALLAAGECAPECFPPQVRRTLAIHAVQLVQTMLRDRAQRPLLTEWLSTAGQRLAPLEREAVVQGLLATLQDAEASVLWHAARGLRQIGSGSEAAVKQGVSSGSFCFWMLLAFQSRRRAIPAWPWSLGRPESVNQWL